MVSIKLSGILIGYYPMLSMHEVIDDVSHAITPCVKRGIYELQEIVYKNR
jgi:hypothetical protein